MLTKQHLKDRCCSILYSISSVLWHLSCIRLYSIQCCFKMGRAHFEILTRFCLLEHSRGFTKKSSSARRTWHKQHQCITDNSQVSLFQLDFQDSLLLLEIAGIVSIIDL